MFELTLINSEFGQVLNAEGNLFIRGTKEFCPRFNTITEALNEKDLLLKKYTYAGVIVTDLESGEIWGEFVNDELGAKFYREKQEFYKWMHLPFYKRIFTKKPRFKYYDGKH